MDTGHTFGGSALDRLIYEYEPTGDGSEASAEAGAAPSLDSTPGEADSSAAATETAPAWSPDDPVFVDAVDSRAAEVVNAQLAPLLPLLQALAANGNGAAGDPAGFDWSQVTPLEDNYGELLGTGIGAAMKAELAPVYEFMDQMRTGQQEAAQAQAEQVGNERVDGWIADDLTKNGDLGEKAKASIKPLAEQLLPEFAGRYGAGPRAAELAVQKAAQIVRGLVAEARSNGVVAHEANLGTVAGARGEAGAGSGSGVVTLGEKPMTSRELALKYGGKAVAMRSN